MSTLRVGSEDTPQEIPWARYHEPEWQEFLKDRRGWARARANPSEVLLSLPSTAIRAAQRLYTLGDAERTAEAKFAELCESWSAVGYGSEGPLKYQPLFKPQPMFRIVGEQAEWCLAHGWAPEDIKSINAHPQPREDILPRLSAAAGRLVSRRDFLKERDRLRRLWRKIPLADRPPLPFRRPCELRREFVGRPEWMLRPNPSGQEAFWDEFVMFVDRWQIIEMTTWDLPLPQGLRSSGLSLGADREGTVELVTPWHFPLERSDNVGEAAFAIHAEYCQKYGVDDHDSWQTYARLLPIAHWTSVCEHRYPATRKAKGFSSLLTQLLAEILGLTEERTKKLRSVLNALREGERTTLRGYR